MKKKYYVFNDDDFYCAGIVNFTMSEHCRKLSENFGIPNCASPTMYEREPQIVPENLSHNIAKRWRSDKTFACTRR